MNKDTNRSPNHLAGETSPYLKQHMYNPVDWYSWGDVAFKKAMDENKPVFLSIGYSTCHWCHVMAHESFEDEKTAEFLNNNFISIKLDREERPDLDQIYQHVIQMMGGRGGWPLSIFMTPNKKPFFAGTYFPNERKYGMRSFMEILENIVKLYSNRRHDVEHTGNQIQSALDNLSSPTSSLYEEITKDMLELAMVSIEPSFDSTYGGFGGAPKFPNFPTLLFLVRQLAEYEKNNSEKFANLKRELENTLDRMAAGGIYDHVGGGFARYSVDAQWMIPHFEKMLYDNALALQVYSEAYFLFQKPRYKEVVQETVDWVFREMYHENSGFYSALDADSEGEEGKYYVWTKIELEENIAPDMQDIFFQAYGITDKGNFEHSTNHLYIADENLGRQQREKFKFILESLLSVREKRIPPSLDNKIITAWSSLMVKGLYSAYRILGDSKIREKAHSIIFALHENMFSLPGDKILYRIFDVDTRKSKIPGHLDDYAYLIQALFEDFQYYPDQYTFQLIQQLLEIAHDQFWDTDKKGYFYSSSMNKDIILRLKTGSDMPLPNPNSVMAENLLQYHFYIADPENNLYLKRAEQALFLYIESAYSHPTGYGATLLAAQWYLYGSIDVVIMNNDKPEEDIYDLVNEYYIPRLHLWFKDEIPSELVSFSKKFDMKGKYSLYFCIYFNCLPPTSDWDIFLNLLQKNLINLSR